MRDHTSLEVPIMNTVFLCECAHVTRAVILNTETGQKLCAHHRCSVVCMIFMDDDTETHLVMEGKTITLCGSAIANMKMIYGQVKPPCVTCTKVITQACCEC